MKTIVMLNRFGRAAMMFALAAFIVTSILAIPASAQTAADSLSSVPTVVTVDVSKIKSIGDVLPLALALLTPFLIGLTKSVLTVRRRQPDGTYVDELPAWFPKWLPLVLAPVVPFFVTWIASLAGAQTASPLAAVLLGALSVYLREIWDQIRKSRASAAV
ncbi:MAG: hypothetical protein HY962_07145 [Ignavibacteriae bacterium]|nr:hypothetical protein [Ignavibacteriota bacterium]